MVTNYCMRQSFACQQHDSADCETSTISSKFNLGDKTIRPTRDRWRARHRSEFDLLSRITLVCKTFSEENMEISEENHLYDQLFSVENSQIDSRRLIIYDFPVTLNQNGIYNILEHIECPPSNIVLMDRSHTSARGGGSQMEYAVSSKTGSVAIVEFASKALVDKAFYIITSKYKNYLNAQYAYRSTQSNITAL